MVMNLKNISQEESQVNLLSNNRGSRHDIYVFCKYATRDDTQVDFVVRKHFYFYILFKFSVILGYYYENLRIKKNNAVFAYAPAGRKSIFKALD